MFNHSAISISNNSLEVIAAKKITNTAEYKVLLIQAEDMPSSPRWYTNEFGIMIFNLADIFYKKFQTDLKNIESCDFKKILETRKSLKASKNMWRKDLIFCGEILKSLTTIKEMAK